MCNNSSKCPTCIKEIANINDVSEENKNKFRRNKKLQSADRLHLTAPLNIHKDKVNLCARKLRMIKKLVSYCGDVYFYIYILTININYCWNLNTFVPSFKKNTFVFVFFLCYAFICTENPLCLIPRRNPVDRIDFDVHCVGLTDINDIFQCFDF